MKYNSVYILVTIFFNLHSQIYHYECESKLRKQIVSERWQEKMNIIDKKFLWTEKLPNKDVFSYKASYSYMLNKDTIFIIGINSKNDSVIHPQYSLRRYDSLLFLTESNDGFENGSTEGQVWFIKDTVLKVNRKKWNCYLFCRTDENREAKEVEYIFIDQQKLVPIKNETIYFDKKNKQILESYKNRVLKKISKK